MVFDDRGMPWTIRIGLVWTIILALCCAGTLFILLGLYLAYWVRTRQGHSAALWCYLILAAISILGMVTPTAVLRHISPATSIVLDVVWAAVLVLLVAAPLVLRGENKSIYRSAWGVELPKNLL